MPLSIPLHQDMEVLDIKEQGIGVSVSAVSGSSSDDGTTGLATPASTSTERDAKGGSDELHVEYWKSALGDHEFLPFPTVPRSVNELSPDQAVKRRLSSLHGASDVNVQSIIHAAWALVAGQMIGSQDIVFGVSILTGDLVEGLPFRLRWSGDQLVRSFLLVTQKEAVELSSSWAEGPGSISHTGPGAGQACEFQTLVTFRDKYQDVSIGSKPTGKRYALELDVLSRDGEYLVSASSDSRVISASLVDRLLLRLDHVVTQLCSCQPQQTIDEVNLMTEKDLESIWNWNREVPQTLDRCVHSIIEDQVRANPEAPAICAWDGNLTYAELNDRAGQVAERLSAAGLRPGSMVPLCFDKSMWANITMLGVLKAGGALVMLDPMLPEQRLKSIVEQVEAELIVSSPSNHELSSRLCDKVEVVRPQEFGGEYHVSGYSASLYPSSTAYVQFTSGSTGVPKGSAISHRSISSAIRHQLGPLGFNSRSRVYDFSSYSFDLSIYNALTTLTAGGCLCVPTDSGRKDDLTASILSLRSNTLTLTPSTAQILHPEELPDVKTIVFAGEALRVQDAAPWWKQARVVNIYGPSECTPVSTMSYNCPSPAQVIDIGMGVGMNTWIVDANDHQRLLPPGCVGELILEGPLVSTGYLRNAESNAKTYIEDPTWLLQGYGARHPGRHARLYKTGDLVRYNENGSITFVARKDTQVKIRGQRVELGEVETRIQECLPEVLQVAAEVITTNDSNPMLVAFVLQNKNVALSPEALKLYRVPEDARHKIATKLPPYMIPAAYLSVAQMPATASGKLDRKRLREIGAALSPEKLAEMSVDEGTKKQPSSEAERRMQNIWGQVLKFNDATLIGVEDNFFQLGGDSITAMKIVRLLRELGLEISVASILRFPVLQDIATRVVDASCDSDEAIPPFSLLPEDCDISSVLRSYHLDPGQVQDAFPCTAIQEGLVSLSSQRSGDYLTQAIVELSCGVSIDRFCYAWSAVVEAIPLLRTRFVQGDTGLLQVVLHEQVSWKEVDDLQAYLDEDRKQPMRLGQAFTRYTLAKDATGRVASFVLTAHHALHDGWSLGLIMETLDNAYTGRKTESFQPFQKFIKYIQNEDVDQTSNFWKKTLEGCESVSFPALPPSVEKPKADTLVSHQLPNSVSNIDATTSTIIRAAWALVVGCMVNSDDVVFGATVSGRHAELSGIDQIPGPTIATVPMRFHVDKSQKVTSFLSQSQKQTTDMIPHEQMGLARIAKLSSDCEQACKFQTLLVIQPEETGIWTNSVGQLREENAMQWSSSYGLVLEVQLGHPQSTVTASFDSRLIDRSAVEGLLSGLELVIDQIASADLESAMTIKDINVLTPDDLNTLLSWNKVVPETIDMCIHEVVHQRAVEKPEQPAISAWDGDMKYDELDTLSTKLASHLRRIGVGKDTIVPLCFEKSMWTPVAMLAVLKAGGAFLLLDPSLPLARLEVMVRHVDATLILATDTCADLASSLIGSVITVGMTLFSTLDHSSDDSQFCSDSSSNAYIIFTSGSTGNPKGVVITHRNVVSAVTQHSKAFQYEQSSRIYDFSSYSFGASLNNMFCALTSGACLCIPNDDDRKSNLAESLTSLRATDVLLTPSMAEHLSPESVPTLRSLILGGEAVRAQDGNQWLGHVTLRTAYGQSETTTVATVNPHPATAEQAISIGRGVGLVTWVVDPENHENLLPLGSIGELLVEGPAVGHGYFKDPKKTAEVFISDPHWLIRAGRRGRLYKTGDLVRYNNDGTLAYLGRKDSQVKIRGQRIELGDVEYWVREFMIEADQVVVEAVTPKGPGGRPTLAAFIKVSKAEGLFEQGDAAAPAKLIRIDAEVEKMLRRQLPSYMVPTIFIAMKSLPMTPTGKMNRRELRIIGGDISAEEVRSIQLANNGTKRQPVTDKEHQMQRVWSQVLGIEQRRIDLNANFFQIGGNSIAAMRVVGAARKLGLGITVAEIFQHHTLRLVAEKSRYTSNNKVSIRPFALLGNRSDASEVRRVVSQACRVDPEMIEDAYPCTPLQEGLFSLASKRPGDYIMQAVLELSPKVDIAMFRKAWEAAMRAAAVLRTRIVHDQKLDLVQVVLNEKPKWHETTGLDDYMQADRTIHMALSTPLSRLALVKNDKGHVQWFVLSMHHALYDGWSLSLILDMVRDAYSGTDLEEAAFQPFINYVLQQVDDVKTGEYWQAELDGCEFAPYPALPASISQPVSDTVVQHLVSRPKDSYLDVTPAILARASWAIVTSRVTNSQDVVFGVTTSGRNAPVMNIDKMPAPAFATVPVRIQTSASQRVSDYLEAVQQQAITMIPFEQLGLHRITKISADAQQACSFQTLFLVQQQATETFGDSDLGLWQNRDQQEFFNPYPLTVEANLLQTGDLSLKAIFDSRIISRWIVEKLLHQFDLVVRQIERTRPRQTLGDISTMTEADLQQIWTWNQVVPGPAADTCFRQFVEKQAKAHPERSATSINDAVHAAKGAGINTWVVDPTNANILLPPGSIGELLLEGPIDGLGYVNHPESTTGSFIHDPTWLVRGLSGQAGRSGQLFKTGHLVQYDEHGNLDFLGHKDSQVKSRGLPHWRQQRGTGSSFHAQTLDEKFAQAAIPKRQPETPLERQLQQIWARVLDLDPTTIGLDDSFFHLGGDSVAAIKVASEARKTDINITVAELFQHPTLGEAAGQLASQSSEPVEKIAPFSLLASNIDVKELATELASQMHASVDIIQDAYQCTPLQVGLLSLSFKRPGDYVMQATIELDPGCDISRFKQAWETTVQATPVLRTRIVHSQSAGLVQAVLDERISWNESSESLDAYLQQDRDSSMDIGEPLTRYCMIRDGSDKPKYFVWTMHHALYDGWSMKLIMEAINRAFRGEQSTTEWPQFQQFIKHLQDQDDEALERYWRESLEGFDSAPYPEVPKSLTEQPVADSSIEHSFIHSQSKESGIMPATLVRAAWALVAGSASNSSDVVFGVTLSGRNAPISGIVNMPGPTITTVPVRIDTSSGQTVSSYLQKAQVQATTMISFEQYGLQRIAKVSSDAQRATQFQTLLVVQPAGDDDFLIDESMGRFCDNTSQANRFNTQPLLIEVTLGKDKITASANFDSDVIPSWLIKRLLQRLEIVMQQLDSAGPGTILDQIDSVELSEAERVGMSGNTHQESLPCFSFQDQTQENGPKRQPVTEAERELHAIWSQVLTIDPSEIGLDDNLFHLGGDSVSAMMIVQQARKIGIKLTVSDIFRHPTLQDIASSSFQETGTDKHTESFEPFALIGGEKLSFLRDISARYDIDESTIQNAYPCTPLQEGLISLTSKRTGAYVMQNIIKLNVKIDRFRQAWEDVVANLPILRTMIVHHPSLGLLQVVSNTVGEWSEADNLDAYVKADRESSMDIGCPLSRHAIVQDGARGDYFVWTIHHALYDGWTIKLMIQALEAALRNEVSAKWPSYQPFINYIRTQDRLAQTQYWEKAFVSYESSPFPALPPSIEQPIVDSILEHQFPNPGGLTTKMGVTASILIRAAWALVAGHTSLTDDVVFGVTLSGRNAPISDIDNMPAPTIATVPVRVNTTKTQKVTTYLESVQDQATMQIPFEHTGLHRISKVSSECQQACTFQTLLIVHPQGTTDMELTFGSWLDTEQEADFTTYAVMLELFLGKDSISGKASFDSRVIASWQVKNLLERLESTIAQLSNANANTTLNDITAMTPQDLDLIWERNSNLPATVERCVHHMIRDVVKVHPTAQAINAWDGTLAYAELDRLTDSLGSYLVEYGVQPGQLIPVLFEKSLWTPVVMLAVLKAEAAFVLLDRSLPEERLRVISRQVGSNLIITSSQNRAMASHFAQHVIEVGPNTIDATLRPQVPRIPGISQNAHTPMFVIFTSGSTGTPKGAILSHANFCSQIEYQAEILGYRKDTRVFDYAAYSFDAAVHNVFTTFAVGGCLCIPSDDDREGDVTKVIADMAVTMVDLTPTVARLLEPSALPLLKTLTLSGEAVSVDDAKRWSGHAHVINAYGPAEAGISTINHQSGSPEQAVSIGAGAGLLTWIVHPDDSNILLPPGVVGELLLEGPLVGQGYLNDKDKTAGYFIESPTWLLQGTPHVAGRQGRLYKTGDLVQYNQDGSLIYLGRKDTQVKIRGQRIELGEIEHCLTNSMSSIEQVIVEAIKPKDGKGKTLLAAFMVRDSRGSTTESEDDLSLSLEDLDPSVMEVLKSQLPATMIPSVFFSMPRLPLTATGKTNRKILRDLGAHYSLQQLAGNKSSNVPKLEPTTPEQKRMLEIWAAVLELDCSMIGIDDDFLHLGGDSIAAMKVAGEARQVGLQLSVADIFRTPTIRALAVHTSLSPKGVSHAIMPLPHSGPVELSFAQGRLWFLEQLYPGLTWYLMPIAIRFRGALQLDALEESLQVIESRHDTLRSTFLTRNNVHFQQVHRFVPKKLTIVDITSADERSLSEALRKDQATTFDLTREAGWRVTVYRISEGHHVLSVMLHHINSDGWSVQVFRKELAQLYSAAIKGRQLDTELRPLQVQYRDYSAWQKHKLMNGEYQRQLEYWTDKLQTSRPVEFLTDKQRPKTLSGKAGEHEFSIEGNTLNRIQALCKEYAVTPFVILLAVFRATHYRMTGTENATMGTPNANRDRSELKDMIGFFVNMLCFRLTVEDDSFESLVRQVQQQTVESFDNQDIPFEQIVSKLNRERDLSRHPIVQVVFAYHTRGILDTVELEGVDSEMLELVPTTRFDLELHFFEEADSLKGVIIYSTDLYTPATITNMLSVFMAVLEGALNEPQSKIATLPLLTAEGYSELKSMGLLEIHQTNYPRDMSIVDVFQQQVTAHPDKVAVKDSLSQITFATLNERSDLVSQYLRRQGFSTETVIPVIAKRSVETIISFLGILKANMAYLPLDPNAPIERTKLVLSSIHGSTIILLGKSVRSPDIQNTKSISIQSVLEDRVQSSFFQRLRTLTKPSASSLAYVLYTSGSTGKPKGVMVEHRSILRLVMQSNCTQYLTGNGAVAHMANTIFDASTLEIYMALLNGLTLVCLDHELVLDHAALQKAFSEERIGAAFFTPAHLKQILADSPMTLSQLDTLMVGGDRFDTEDCIQARRVVKGHIINGYGPTENTVFSTMYHVEVGDSWANGLPIGRAISNSGAYIMDSQLNLQPLGVVGELVVTGDGLARGYTESQLNTDRFVTVNIDGQQLRAYRTGDLARFRPVDGLIEFFGRADAQVKIRGHRVELGEIEHVLLGHGSVTDAVALIYQGEGQQPQLYAFAAVPSPMVYERVEVDDTSDAKGGEEEKDEEAEHMQVWSGVFDGDKYVSIDDGQVLGRDFVGWTSMYDGALIDRGEMNEWLDDTIAAMNQNLGAGHVLELGTGSGMILFNLIQGLNSYIGLDPSDRAVDYVNKAAQSIPSLANKARVYKGTADQVGQLLGPVTPNIVICNSVAQYFPSQEYLFKVIDELVQKEGIETLFFGDMRSQAMYSEFCVTQVLSRSGDNISKADLRQSITHIARKEMEFLVDPGFFTGLQSRLPEFVEHVEILPKNMVATNELSCYRYAAVIHVKRRVKGQRRVHDIQRQHWIDFAEQGLDRSALVQRLRDSSPQTLPVSNIPYNKTLHERLVVEHLAKSTNDASSDQDGWVSSLRTAAQQCPSFSAYELKEIAKQTGYHVEISWARQFSLHGGFDAVFHQIEPDQEGTRVLFQFPNDYEGRPLHTMTSQPLLQQARQRVREELEARLVNHLPTYMIPKVVTILDEMPVNASGKVDRKALVGTLRTRTALVRGEVREPNTKTEEKLQGIWARVLNISSDGIGLDDSFFQLGGDSITAMKVVNEARKLGIDLAVSDIFRSDNLEDLALQALQHVGEADQDEEPIILVDETTKSALLRELDASGTSIRPDQVADILPLTSMQKRYIKDGYTNGLFVHYFFLDFRLDLDIERLKASLQQLLQSIPILRAAFLELQGKYWQVIPEVLDLPWVIRDVEESLPEALGNFCRADIKTVSFVEPPALFALLRNKTEGLRLVIRFSHAQYDGSSFPAIIKPLIDGYFGRPTTTGLDYSAFLAYIVRRRPASITYWKDLLQGSSITTLQPHVSTGTQVLKPALISVQSEVTLPSLPGKFTTATLASAAWALLLAQTTRGKDIVYGHIVTGRNARICGPEEPVGACLNVVPVRATMSSSQTPRELLRLLQMQFSSMGDADSLGYEDIIENCTSWPAGTQFESLIHHANINEHPEFEFGKDKVKLEFFYTSELMTRHIMLMSYPVGNRLQFNMMANTSIMSVEVAQILVNRLCTIVSKMGDTLDEPVFKWLDELRSSV